MPKSLLLLLFFPSPLLSCVTRDAALNQDGSHQQLAEMPLLIKSSFSNAAQIQERVRNATYEGHENSTVSQPKSLMLNTSRQITQILGIHRTNSNLTWRNKIPLTIKFMLQLRSYMKNLRTSSSYIKYSFSNLLKGPCSQMCVQCWGRKVAGCSYRTKMH